MRPPNLPRKLPVKLTFPLRRLLDCFSSYFGALLCVAWSPDGRFVVVRRSYSPSS